MTVKQQIKEYLAGQPESKRIDLKELHELIQKADPSGKLWFLDGRNEAGKVVSNPNVGYGTCTMEYAGGKTREFYRIGLSANTTGISVYVMGLEDKTFLAKTYGKKIGKASVTGYCIKFRNVADIDIEVLESAVRSAFGSLPAKSKSRK